jgi:SAM-dependent methyltransferase
VSAMSVELLTLLRCPACGARFNDGPRPASSALVCERCATAVPVDGDIPRFVRHQDDEAAARTRDSFGYEWTHFHDWRHSGQTNFDDYFQGIDLGSFTQKIVLDAGCGMGRHSRQIARFARRVVAVDFSRAIDQAAKNTRDLPNVDCVQADLLALPFPDGSFDFAYSLGVLHHLADTERALAVLVSKLKPGGKLRVYLYWKRHGWPGLALRFVTTIRRFTTRIPFGVLRWLCLPLSVALYGGIVLPYGLLSRMGFSRHEGWPLFVYTRYPFNVIYNDQFDRFSAPIEKRYDSADVRRMLQNAGLIHVSVRACYGWLADGTKPV